MYNILLAQFLHETNSFSEKSADMESYRNKTWIQGEDVLSCYRGSEFELSGFIHVLEAEADVNMVPVLAADAMPCGPVTAEVFEQVASALLETVRTQSIDGILLSLHGAMVTETDDDGEGALLERLRRAVGPAVPLVVTLDLHANVTARMYENADVLIACDYYPHTDLYERGVEAAQLMLLMLRGQTRPCMRCVGLPLLMPPFCTDMEPAKHFVEEAHRLEAQPGVLSVSIAHGFFCSDSSGCGVMVIAVTDGQSALAENIARTLADEIWEKRAQLVRTLYSVEEAVALALREKEGPIVLADTTDNPGGGSYEDGTLLLREMLEQGMKEAAVAFICDEEAAAAACMAGEGAEIHLQLGGKKRPELLGEPISCAARVRCVTDGRFVARGKMDGGMTIDLGPSATVEVGGIEIIVTSRPYQPKDPSVFPPFGIDPYAKKYLLLKSSIHYRSGFTQMAKRLLDVDGPGLMPQNVRSLSFRRIKRPIFPLDNI